MTEPQTPEEAQEPTILTGDQAYRTWGFDPDAMGEPLLDEVTFTIGDKVVSHITREEALADRILSWVEGDIAESGGTGRRYSRILMAFAGVPAEAVEIAVRELVADRRGWLDRTVADTIGFVYFVPTSVKEHRHG